MNPDPNAANTIYIGASHFARKYYLRRQFSVIYPLLFIIFILSVLASVVGLIGFLGKMSWFPSGVLLGFPIALLSGLGCYQMNRAAHYFANLAIDEGNYTPSDITSFYESCYAR